MASQKTQVLQYLQEGHELTPLEALRLFGCFRLGARIHDLKAEGYDIEMKLVKGVNNRYASYRLRSAPRQMDFIDDHRELRPLPLCDGCATFYTPPNRMPKTGQRSFCPACRASRIPQKQAERDYRARLRNDQE